MGGEVVIVCCHAICTNHLSPHQESSWLLKPFQRSDAATGKPGEHETFLLHIGAGADALRRPQTVLVFSGAKTESEAHVSEAESYRRIFMQLYGDREDIRQAVAEGRVLSEDAATDSYQNLLFSLIRYYRVKGEWPGMVTLITHSFKETRFLECHATALRWPDEKIRVQGINPPFPLAELREVEKLEGATVGLFRDDPHGANAPLSTKRKARQWDSSADVTGGISDDSVARALQGLLDWTDSTVFPHALPWDATSGR